MKLTKLLAAGAAAATLLLTGCASYVTTNVTAFQRWSGKDADRTYTFWRNAAQQNNLEQSAYESLVDNTLKTYGFKLVDPVHAHYSVALDYDIRNQTTMVSQPVMVAAPAWRGGYGPWYGPFPPYAPYGPVSVIYDTEPYPFFVKMLSIRVFDNTQGKAEVYNVSASNAGPDGSLAAAMPYLVRSALFNFPMANGSAVQVNLPYGTNGTPNERPIAAPPAPPAAPTAAPAPAMAPAPASGTASN